MAIPSLVRHSAEFVARRYARRVSRIHGVYLPRTDEVVEGDWLCGFAKMWKTAIAKRVGSMKDSADIAMGEDLDFGLRMAQHGKIFMNAALDCNI